jgi:hypothetical protein
MQSLVTDMLFLHRFYRNQDPWQNLRKIYDSILNDFKPAAEMGWTLIENPRAKSRPRADSSESEKDSHPPPSQCSYRSRPRP